MVDQTPMDLDHVHNVLHVAANNVVVQTLANISTVCFLPPVGVRTAASVDKLIANYVASSLPRLAASIIIVSFLAVGY
jgi:hypothetical protein